MTLNHSLTLDDRIYCLQRTTKLPEELANVLTVADTHYIQERDVQALELVNYLEMQCRLQNIDIYLPINISAAMS